MSPLNRRPAAEGARGSLLADTRPPRATAGHTPLGHLGRLGRLGTPEGIARVAVFLASEDASHVSGAHLVVDGGWSAVLPDPLT